jgi:hypothetical protein
VNTNVESVQLELNYFRESIQSLDFEKELRTSPVEYFKAYKKLKESLEVTVIEENQFPEFARKLGLPENDPGLLEKLKRSEIALRVIEASAEMLPPLVREKILDLEGSASEVRNEEVILENGRAFTIAAPFAIDAHYIDHALEILKKRKSDGGPDTSKFTTNEDALSFLRFNVQRIAYENLAEDGVLSRRTNKRITGALERETALSRSSKCISEINDFLVEYLGDDWLENQEDVFNTVHLTLGTGDVTAVFRKISSDVGSSSQPETSGVITGMMDYLGLEIVLVNNAKNLTAADLTSKGLPLSQVIEVSSQEQRDDFIKVADARKGTSYAIKSVNLKELEHAAETTTSIRPSINSMELSDKIALTKYVVDAFLNARHLNSYFQNEYARMVELLKTNVTNVELSRAFYEYIALDFSNSTYESKGDVSGASNLSQKLNEVGILLPEILQPFLEKQLRLGVACGGVADNIAGDSIDVSIVDNDMVEKLSIDVSPELSSMSASERAVFFGLASQVLFSRYVEKLKVTDSEKSELTDAELRDKISVERSINGKVSDELIMQGFTRASNSLAGSLAVKAVCTAEPLAKIVLLKTPSQFVQFFEKSTFDSTVDNLESIAKSHSGNAFTRDVTRSETEFSRLVTQHAIINPNGVQSVEFNPANPDDPVTAFVSGILEKMSID